jgi:hypothetical protein
MRPEATCRNLPNVMAPGDCPTHGRRVGSRGCYGTLAGALVCMDPAAGLRNTGRLRVDPEGDEEGVLNYSDCVVVQGTTEGAGFQEALVQTGYLFAFDNGGVKDSSLAPIKQDVSGGGADLCREGNHENVAGPAISNIRGNHEHWTRLAVSGSRPHACQENLSPTGMCGAQDYSFRCLASRDAKAAHSRSSRSSLAERER